VIYGQSVKNEDNEKEEEKTKKTKQILLARTLGLIEAIYFKFGM